MQFKQIQAFYAVMMTGTVTDAARQLGISQPGVSNLLASFEHYLGFKLFKRIKGRLHPTPEAQRLFDSSEGVIEGFDLIARRASAIRHLETGKLVVAGLPEMSLEFLPVSITKFLTRKPKVNISFQTRASTKIQEMVSDHLIEIGITEGPVAHDNLAIKKFTYPCYCVVPIDHPLTRKKIITPKDLHEQPLITLGQYHMTYHRLREIFTKSNCIWNDRCQARLFSSALVFAREGMGIALVDPFTINSQSLKKVIIRSFKPTVSYDLITIIAKDRPLSLLGQSFVDFIHEEMTDAQERFKPESFLSEE